MTDELERLALSEWPESAAAQVVSVTVSGDRAEVALLVNGYEYWEYFRRDASGHWIGTVSGNGPTPDWGDPTSIKW